MRLPGSARPGRFPLAAWGVGAALFATASASVVLVGRPVAGVEGAGLVGAILADAAGDAALWGGALWATARWPLGGRVRVGRLAAAAAVHLAVGVAAGGAVEFGGVVSRALAPWLAGSTSPLGALRHLPGYVAYAVLAHTLRLARRAARARATRRALGRTLAEVGRAHAAAELRALKAELHPLLVARTLRDARALVPTDPDAAERAVVRLGALMREAVVAAGTDEVLLEDEVALYADRDPAVRFEVGPGAGDVTVPHFLVAGVLACVTAEEDPDGRRVVHAALDPAGTPRLHLTVTSERPPRAAPGRARGGETSADARAVLRRRLDHFYGAGAWSVDAAPPPAATPAADTRPDAPRRDALRLVLPAVERCRPAPDSLERWVVAAAGADAPAPSLATPALAVAAAVGGLTAMVAAQDALVRGGPARPGVWLNLLLSLCAVGGSVALATWRWPLGAPSVGAAPTRAGGRARPRGALVGHALAAAGAAGVLLALTGADWLAEPRRAAGRGAAAAAAEWALFAAFSYPALAGAAHLALFRRERREAARVVRALRGALGTQARGRTRSELRALKAELNPHFVGNALHTAAALVRRDPDAAERMFAALGVLAEEAGARVDTQEVSLGAELAGLEPFLALEGARLRAAGGALSVVWDVPDDVRGAAVPHLLLQPLAENAVRHGLAPRGGAGTLTVSARRRGDRLELAVADDGVGPGARAAGPPVPGAGRAGVTGGVGAGAGLGGVRRRLALLYGAQGECALEAAPGGGAVSRVTIPYRAATPGSEVAAAAPVVVPPAVTLGTVGGPAAALG
jgi:hypothetical protein